MLASKFVEVANSFGSQEKEFYFIVDFEKNNPLIFENQSNDFALKTSGERVRNQSAPSFTIAEIGLDSYTKKFDLVTRAMLGGDSWLTNLTIKTELRFESPPSIRELFESSNSLASVYLKIDDDHECLSQSPEAFITIEGNEISTRPMKGTRELKESLHIEIERLLNDPKEAAEHLTVVDLLRNDLGIIADQIEVPNYRYIDLIEHPRGSLIATSSEVRGQLNHDWKKSLGDLIMSVLPAGSVSGAPKAETCKIISKAEGENRGYFTGVAGHFDGKNLQSYVLIRFIERIKNEYFYRSGGGLTIYSNALAEYQEALAKIYLA